MGALPNVAIGASSSFFPFPIEPKIPLLPHGFLQAPSNHRAPKLGFQINSAHRTVPSPRATTTAPRPKESNTHRGIAVAKDGDGDGGDGGRESRLGHKVYRGTAIRRRDAPLNPRI